MLLRVNNGNEQQARLGNDVIYVPPVSVSSSAQSVSSFSLTNNLMSFKVRTKLWKEFCIFCRSGLSDIRINCDRIS